MGRIILVLCLLIGFAAQAQYPPGYTGINQRYDWFLGKFRGLHVPGKGADDTTFLTSQWRGAGAVVVDTVNNKFYFWSGGQWREAGGGATNDNVGSAYRLAIPNTNDIKTLNNRFGIDLDSADANQIGIIVDTVEIATRARLTHVENGIRSALIDTAAAIRGDFPSGGTSYWFNVKDYGALGNGVADDTDPIQDAINAAFAAGGGTVYFPNGKYIISGPLITSLNSKNPNCQLYIPLSAPSLGDDGISIKLLGETPPNNEYSVLIGWQLNESGAIIESTIVGSGTRPSIFGTSWVTAFSNINTTDTWMENLTIRARSKTSGGVDTVNNMTAVNFGALGNFVMKNCRVDIQSEMTDSEEPASQTIGVYFPYINNSAYVRAENILVTGYYTGIRINEHFNGANLNIGGCYRGIQMDTMNHDVSIDRVLFNGVAYHLWITGRAIFDIQNFDAEILDDGEWFDYVADLNEILPLGQGKGIIRWYRVNAPNNDFVRVNEGGSRYLDIPMGGTNPTWAERPLTPDSATIGYRPAINHFEGYGGSAAGWKILAHMGQTMDFYTLSSSRWGLGGNPGSSTYKMNIYDSAGSAGNLLSMHTAASGLVRLNTAGATTQLAYLFAKAGTTVYQVGMNFNTDATPDFYIYDQVNSVAKFYTPSNTGHVFIGGNAFTAPPLRIFQAGDIGIGIDPTAYLTIKAGTATAGDAPLKFTTGTLLGTPEAGAVEFNSDKYYATITTSAARKELTLNDAALTSGRVPIVTTNGRLTDDADMTFSGSTLSLGVAGSTLGTLTLTGNTSGTITIKGQAAAGTYNFNLPTTAGTAGQILTSQAGGSNAMTWTDLPTLASGTHTPTPINTTNVASSTAYEVQYMRVGNTVTVSGKIDITATATGALELRMDVPIASSFGSDGQAGGSATARDKSGNATMAIMSVSGSGNIALRYVADDTGAHTYWFEYTYQIVN